MSARLMFLFNRLSRTKFHKLIEISTFKIPNRNISVPCAVGFSLFTWLGFQKEHTVEDELIQTIKHCVLFIQKTEYDKAEQLLHVALRQAQHIQHRLGITYIYDVMANLALEREQLEKAKKLFVAVTQRIMADGVKEDDSRVVHISVKLARISHLQKEYTTAQLGYDWCLEKLHKTLQNEPSEDIEKLIAVTEDWYGRLFLDCNQTDQGLKLMISALERMQKVSELEKEHIVIQINDIGTVYHQIGKADESINYFKKAIEMAKELPEMKELGAMYVNLGRAYMKKNLLDNARKNCGYGWKLGKLSKNESIKREAKLCIKEINNMS